MTQFKQSIKGMLLVLASAFVVVAQANAFTDLLPPNAAANQTVISNGTGWSYMPVPAWALPLTSGPTEGVIYQSTSNATINGGGIAVVPAQSTFTATLQGNIGTGSITLPIAWFATGRTIVVTAAGTYATPGGGQSNWNWGIFLGTTPIVNATVVATGNQSTAPAWHYTAIIQETKAAGPASTVNGFLEVLYSSGTLPSTELAISTAATGVTVDLSQNTSQNVVNPTFQWAAVGSTLTLTNVVVELKN